MSTNENLVFQLTISDLQKMIQDAVSKGVSQEIASHRLKVEQGVKMLKPTEVRLMARCGNNLVYAALKSGVLPSVIAGKTALGDRRLIRTEDAEKWILQGMPKK